jgi:hypothetical protein
MIVESIVMNPTKTALRALSLTLLDLLRLLMWLTGISLAITSFWAVPILAIDWVFGFGDRVLTVSYGAYFLFLFREFMLGLGLPLGSVLALVHVMKNRSIGPTLPEPLIYAHALTIIISGALLVIVPLVIATPGVIAFIWDLIWHAPTDASAKFRLLVAVGFSCALVWLAREVLRN